MLGSLEAVIGLKLFQTGADRPPPDICIAVAIEIVFFGFANYSSIAILISISIDTP
jgi:hypothetical protein